MVVLAVSVQSSKAAGQQGATPDELKQAETEVPQLAGVLGLKRGMTVADVGTGGGAMTLVMARWLGPAGRVYATDVDAATVRSVQEQAARAKLGNVVTVIGTQSATRLPRMCCEAIWLRNVYHHLTDPAREDGSLFDSLKDGGSLAVIDFRPMPGSKPPAGVPADRTGHGIVPEIVARELTAAGFTIVNTIPHWPPPDEKSESFLVLARKPATNTTR